MEQKGRNTEENEKAFKNKKIVKTNGKILLSPKTCGALSVSNKVADEESWHNSDPNIVVELKPEDLTGRIPRTGNPTNRGPVPGCLVGWTSMKDIGRPTELMISSVGRMYDTVMWYPGRYDVSKLRL